ncbi:hypothetical protein BJ165DRAFT_1383826 [Panaeolus papilionaceus]|nr:hypothetical protein BJ165DRAFT_1383826 [Panaeolus papilionaceus]
MRGHFVNITSTRKRLNWLRNHCDYTFQTLQENMPKALAFVDVILIRKWQNHKMRWVNAYRDGLNVSYARAQVQLYSSTRFASHLMVTVGARFDNR